MFALANESLIPYNLTKRAPETRTSNNVTPNANPKQIKKMQSAAQFSTQT